MIYKNINSNIDKFLISLNVFLINIFISFYFLLSLKFKYFFKVYKAFFYSYPKSNINSKFKITKPKNNFKYYHVKSILLEYTILNKKRFKNQYFHKCFDKHQKIKLMLVLLCKRPKVFYKNIKLKNFHFSFKLRIFLTPNF